MKPWMETLLIDSRMQWSKNQKLRQKSSRIEIARETADNVGSQHLVLSIEDNTRSIKSQIEDGILCLRQLTDYWNWFILNHSSLCYLGILLVLSTIYKLSYYQVDYKAAFVNADVEVHILLKCLDGSAIQEVFRNRWKWSPRNFFKYLNSKFAKFGFKQALSDPCLYNVENVIWITLILTSSLQWVNVHVFQILMRL